MTVGERLRIAIDRSGSSVLGFQKRMQARAAEGSSYPAIQRALKGRSTPTVGFLEIASEILGVRPAWLTLGEEPMTEAEKRIAQATEHGGRQRAQMRRTVRNTLHAAGMRGEREGIPTNDPAVESSPNAYVPYWAGPLEQLRSKVWFEEMVRIDPNRSHEDTGQAEKMIGRSLGAPLRAFAIDVNELDVDALGEYVMTMMPALLWLANEMKEPRYERPRFVAGRGTREIPDEALKPRRKR